ncbi:unnamed protein product [Linum trigynum]|uniref:Uncharacterized protein n=1 Tax=Linum trigynum TaxID=586398 RepID=A0AAV2DDI1_9ROSI
MVGLDGEELASDEDELRQKRVMEENRDWRRIASTQSSVSASIVTQSHLKSRTVPETSESSSHKPSFEVRLRPERDNVGEIEDAGLGFWRSPSLWE